MKKIAAGLLMYRKKGGDVEVLLVHPGGPFYKNKDDGVWSIPKGQAESTEEEQNLLQLAKREFKEETGFEAEGPFVYVGSAARSGKVVEAWACEGNIDTQAIHSNTTEIDWPPRSGKKLIVPEVDRGAYFTLAEARTKLSPYMVPLIDAFEKTIHPLFTHS